MIWYQCKKQRSILLAINSTGANNNFYGKTHSLETKMLISQKLTGNNYRTEETIKKWIDEVAKKPKTSEHRLKIAAGSRGFLVFQNTQTMEIIRIDRESSENLNKNLWVHPRKLKPETKFKCDHCEIITTKACLKRWHNQNCKKKDLFMKITNIKSIGPGPVYDISVDGNEQYVLENGIVSHNTGAYYGANDIWIIGRQQDKDKTEISGYHFIINIEKSRFVREKSKIPITVSFAGGIDKWSGLLDLAMEAGYIVKPKNGWYARTNKETGEMGKNMREDDFINNNEFWTSLFEETDFSSWIQEKYTLVQGSIMPEDDDETIKE